VTLSLSFILEAVIRKISELEESLRQTTEAMLTMRTQAEDTP
jgi:hypothetical protein